MHSTKKSQLAAMRYLADKNPRKYRIRTQFVEYQYRVELLEKHYSLIWETIETTNHLVSFRHNCKTLDELLEQMDTNKSEEKTY